jgi:aspartate aminotransferase-like enzyme
MLELLERWVAGRNDVRFLAPAGARSPAISALQLPENRRSVDVLEALERRGYLIGGPLDHRHSSLIRIGHMGDLEPQHLSALLQVLSEVIA